LCGASLRPATADDGLYAVRREPPSVAKESEAAARATTLEPRDSDARDASSDDDTERDDGYGASHGYPPGHSGPSGPGDAPGS